MTKKSPKGNKVDALFEEGSHEFVRTGLYLRKDIHKELAEASKESGHSVNKIVNKILAQFFDMEK